MRIAVILVAWTAATMGLALFMTRGHAKLEALLATGPYWGAIGAAAWLAVATKAWRLPDAGWAAPRWPEALRLGWLPIAFVVLFFAVALSLRLPAPAAFAWIALNTFLVGLSEEWMFRGVLWTALRGRYGLWPAFWLSSALFGSVHALNALVTGELLQALVQSVAAFMSGTFFCALRIRTGSLWPGIVIHGLWDCGLLLIPHGESGHVPATLAIVLPIALVLPNFLYALYLMRRAGDSPR